MSPLEQQLAASIEIAKRNKVIEAQREQIDMLREQIRNLEARLECADEVHGDITIPVPMFHRRQAG